MVSVSILEKLLKLNLKIKNKFLSKTEFEDIAIEEQYQQKIFENSRNKTIVANLVVFLGYFATICYILFAFNKLVHIIICIICFILAVVSQIICNKYKSRQALFINNHIQIFLSAINMVNKGFILCLSFNTDHNDNVEEMLRIIIYDFVSTNIYLVTRLEANIFVYCCYFLLNLSLVIMGLIYSNKNRFYYLEGITSFCVFVIFYAFRKQMDYNQRVVYAEKSKFEKYFIYTMDYLEGLNGYNLNVQNNRNISYGLKMNGLMRKLVSEGFITNEEIEQPLKAKEENESRLAVNGKESNEKEKGNDDKQGLLFNMFFNEFDCFADRANKSENQITLSFLKKLIFFRNYENKNHILNKEEKKISMVNLQDEIIQSKICSF